MGTMGLCRGRRGWAVSGVLAAGLIALAGCGSSGSSSSSAAASGGSSGSRTTPIKLVLAWYPTPEYGGVYAAVQQGYFKQRGLDVTIKPGGPQVSATQVVGSGQADIGFLNNDETLMQAWDNGIQLTEFATTYQKYPEAVEYHKSNPISSLSEVNGKTLSGVTGSVDYQWLQHKYGLKNKVTPFSYATFSHDASSLLLGYAPDDIPSLAAQGVDVGYVPISDSGLQPYADILFAKTDYVKSHADVIKRFLTAFGKGWQYYRNHAHQVNLDIFKADKTTPMKTNDAISKMQDDFIYGGDAQTNGIGTIDKARVTETYQKLRSLKVIKKQLNIDDVANTTLMPKLTPPAKAGQ